jgi:hypothetical protein
VYLALTVGAPAPSCLLQWEMCERFGWTLDYFRALKVAELHEYLQIQDGKSKASKSILRR